MTGQRRHLRVSNADAFPVTVEVALGSAGDRPITDVSAPLERIDGMQTWRVVVPGNRTATLDYGPPRD